MSAIRLHLLKVYGIKYSLEVGGVIGIFVGIFNILTAVLSFVISKYYQTGEELQYAYRIVYIVGIFFCCIAFLLSFGEKDDKFRYPYEEENEDNIKPKEIELKTDISEANSSSKN